LSSLRPLSQEEEELVGDGGSEKPDIFHIVLEYL